MKISNKYGYCNYCLCNNCAKIHGLYVYEEHRRKGHAKELLQQAINEIRNEDYVGKIKIVAIPEEDSITPSNLIKFYKNMGLIIINE